MRACKSASLSKTAVRSSEPIRPVDIGAPYPGEVVTSSARVVRDAVPEVERDWEVTLGSADWRELERLLTKLNEVVTSA